MTRRQARLARQITEAVSDAVANRLGDPRIEAFVSVTAVNITGDLRIADVHLSLFGKGQAAQDKTFAAIQQARSRIQSLVAHKLHSKFCPSLRFHRDDKFKKTLETINLIEHTAVDLEKKDADKNSGH